LQPSGEDEVEQLLCIMEIMGAPPHHLIDAASRKKVFFDNNNQPNVVPNSRGEMQAAAEVLARVAAAVLARIALHASGACPMLLRIHLPVPTLSASVLETFPVGHIADDVHVVIEIHLLQARCATLAPRRCGVC
jgi:hypothetical protein